MFGLSKKKTHTPSRQWFTNNSKTHKHLRLPNPQNFRAPVYMQTVSVSVSTITSRLLIIKMETWFLILIALCISFLIKSIFNLRSPSKKLPPGPFTFPIIGNIHWLRKSLSEIEPILRNLHAKFGPVVTLHIGPRPSVFISDRSLAHQALIQNGAVFSDRPPAFETNKIVSSNQHSISSAFYGPIWRLFRRNLTSEILHPSRIKSYSHARKWVLDILINRLKSQSGDGKPVKVVDHFQYAMFCLLVLMCFGDKLDEKQIEDIERAQRNMLLGFGRYNILNFWPKLTRIFLRKKWEEFLQIRNDQEQVLIPLINARKKAKKEKQGKHREEQKDDGEFVLSYVDTLLELQLPEEKRNLDEGEIVSLSSEFLNTGTDTTSTALQWIMANLVKSPHIQQRVFSEIKEVIGSDEVEEIKEEELHKMKYLKGVILEGLRRHPPGHFVVPHAVTRDIELGGYVVPKKGSVNFMVAEMGWDPKVWEKPMEFKPERFMNEEEVFDITGSREIKMMPFGAGRRICPGLGLAMLHLEYFVANLVWKFEWKAIEGDPIDLSEKQEFTMVMKNPLQACLFPRFS